MKIFGKGFNFSQDGPGNRLVYHVQGCNLSCPWCSNPEGMDFEVGETVSVDALVMEAVSCKPMFFDGGGVTFTGGECTCSFDELREALARLKKEGINTAIETNGTSARLSELFPLVNELIMDFKHYDSALHKKVTGLGNENIKSNLQKAFDLHPDLTVRIPLINNFNASENDMENFARFFASHDTSHARFELLLYHEYGKDKWKKCGKEYTVRDAFVSEEKRIKFYEILHGFGLNTVRT